MDASMTKTASGRWTPVHSLDLSGQLLTFLNCWPS
jgi:hypothetical protein